MAIELKDTKDQKDQKATGQAHGEFLIQRIYIKDISFEAPQSPAVFQQDWKPELDMQLQTSTNKLEEGVHEVILKITVTVKSSQKVAFLGEIQQAGIFTVKSFTEAQVGPILGGVCPGILFPYAREAISDLVNRGTFPPLYLSPINFDALYQQHLHQQQTQPAGEKKSEKSEKSDGKKH